MLSLSGRDEEVLLEREGQYGRVCEGIPVDSGLDRVGSALVSWSGFVLKGPRPKKNIAEGEGALDLFSFSFLSRLSLCVLSACFNLSKLHCFFVFFF
mmetsp:Transcript_16950/g.35170  ORF Transcript_16950/g.35170 Transcript_16950/m.35170 type:complete len:97 (-) Transcript_16950:1139-1429(-)